MVASPDPLRTVRVDDATFFAALDPAEPALAPARASAAVGDWEVAWGAFEAFLAESWAASGDLAMVARARVAGRAAIDADVLCAADELVGGLVVARGFRAALGEPPDWTIGAGLNAFAAVHRWSWSDALWRAHLATGEVRYPRAFASLFSSWHSQRAAVARVTDFDPVWYELNVGTRARHLLRCLYAFGGAVSADARRGAWRQVLGEANHLLAIEEVGYRPGNWQVTGARSLVQLGVGVPFFVDAERWRAVGRRRLLEHLYWDFDAEGGHGERTFGYAQGVVGRLQELPDELRRGGEDSASVEAAEERLARIERWFLAYVTPSGEFVGVGDSAFEDAGPWLSHLATRSGDGRFLWPLRHRSELHGALEPVEPEAGSVLLSDGGWAVLRDGWRRTSHFALVHWGPFAGGHSHDASLDVNCYASGEPLVIEGGSLGYDSPLDPLLRSPDAHNQVVLEGRTMARTKRHAHVIAWAAGARVDAFEAFHDRYRESAGARVRRRILSVKGEYWVFVDTVQQVAPPSTEPGGATMAALLWHARDPWVPDPRAAGRFVARREGRAGAQVDVWPPGLEAARTTLYEDAEELHGERHTLRLRTPAGHARFVTVLAPCSAAPVPTSLDVREVEGGFELVVRRAATTDRWFVRTNGEGAVGGGRLRTDGRLAWVREDSLHAAVVQGAQLEFDGEALLGGSPVDGLLER